MLRRVFPSSPRLTTIAVLLSLALVAACGTDDGDGGSTASPATPGTPAPFPTPGQSSAATFSSLRANIFQPKCVSCHNPANLNGNVDLTTYQSIMNSANTNLVVAGNPLQSDLHNVVVTNRMPPGGPPLSTAEKLAIFTWIQRGAPND